MTASGDRSTRLVPVYIGVLESGMPVRLASGPNYSTGKPPPKPKRHPLVEAGIDWQQYGFADEHQARLAVFGWAHRYNTGRRHSRLGQISRSPTRMP